MNSSEHYESDDESHSDDDNENNGQSQKKVCGHNKPMWSMSGKEYIEFTKDGLCIVPKDAKLSRYLGSLARDYILLPITPKDCRLHEEPITDKLWKTISDTIDWHPEDIPHIPKIRYALLKRLSKRVRNHKAELKRKYYTPYVGSPSRFTCGDDHVDSEQWQIMVNYWDSDPKYKIKREKNIANRKKLKMSHTGGTTSFVRHLAEFEQKHGHAPDPIEGFDLLPKRKNNDKGWTDKASAQMGAKISKELAQLVATHGDETQELRLQAYVRARGFETGGRVRGYGEVVTPNMVPWVQQTQPSSSCRRSRKGRDYAYLQSQFLELQERCEKQQRDMEELRHMVLSSQHQSSRLHSEPSPSQQRSPSQHRSSFQNQPFSQEHSPSQHTASSHQYPPYPPRGPYRYQSSSQFYYPQSYQPPLYQPMPYSHGEFTAMLNEPEFLQQVKPPDQRSRQHDQN